MRMKNSLLLALIFLNFWNLSAQKSGFQFKREIELTEDEWMCVDLPWDIYHFTNRNLSDLRLLGYKGSDTIEIPYLLNYRKHEKTYEYASFSLINQTHDDHYFYYTLELDSVQDINNINLSFSDLNYDWRLRAEGSQDLVNWEIIEDNYRILSVKNEYVAYEYNNLRFDKSKFKYYRIAVNSERKPSFKKAECSLLKQKLAPIDDIPVRSFSIDNNKETKVTQIDVEFPQKVYVDFIKVFVEDSFLFHRKVRVEECVDSVNTGKGWEYKFNTLSSDYLNSFGENKLSINRALVSKIRLIIENRDNQPLSIEKIKCTAYVYQLFMKSNMHLDSCFLMYGDPNLSFPSYDLIHFKNLIPEDISQVKLKDQIEMNLPEDELEKSTALFENKLYLWGVIVIIGLIMAVFTIKMMRNC